MTRTRLQGPDVLFALVVVSLTFLAARVWWTSSIVPGQDYPQFLVLVRAANDLGDPASPFHGTYRTASWFLPTVAPIELTRVLWGLCGGSLERAGKLLLTLENVGLVAASLYLLHELRRPRWAIVLLFPILHSRWTVVGGYVAYATAVPLIVLVWGLTVRWLRAASWRSGAVLAATLALTLLWHGLAFFVAGVGVATLWLLWRADTLRARARSVVPTLPSLVLCGVWLASTFGEKATQKESWSWRPFWDAADHLVDHVWATIPHSTARALLLASLLVGVAALGTGEPDRASTDGPAWRVRSPFLVLAVVCFVGFFVLPVGGLGVEVVCPRFSSAAALAFVFAWKLPRRPAARAVVVGAVALFSAWNFADIARCFADFEVETRGASALIDRVGEHETLYFWPPQSGNSTAFLQPNRAMIELEQFSTIRHGGLPNSSFAGYGVGFVRYVDQDPMPFLKSPPQASEAMKKFDYVLTREGQEPQGPGFQLVERRERWALFAVCGSKHLPVCGGG